MKNEECEGLGAQLGHVLGDLGRQPLATKTLAAAKAKLLHACGVSLASSKLASAQAAWNAVKEERGECFVFGQSRRISAGDAAFVNGVIGHSSLLEDCGPGGLRQGSHPGTYIIPAALAAAEAQAASGRQFLAGLVVGYETVSRIGAAAPLSVVARKFRPLGVMGPLGASTAAATIGGADDRQLTDVLAIAVNMSSGTTQGIFEGSMEPYFQAGMGARNGLFAARLGLAGARTAREALEGEFGFFQTYGGEACNAELLLDLAAKPGIEQVGIKHYAACVQNQNTIALIVDGFEHPVDPETIERVTIKRSESGTNGLNSPGVSRHGPFGNMLSAQMSARFTAAAALMGLPVDDPMFYERNFADSRIEALTQHIDLVPAPGDDVEVVVKLRSGQSIRIHSGGRNILFPDYGNVRAKFVQRATPHLGAKAEQVAALVDKLESLHDMRTLTELFL
ncbi:MAG: MmgE/PrpD family protein [Burkholderiaceae bacterium]|nr:MmgE/PrpD family protein [Burkholderiaceae bacterium]